MTPFEPLDDPENEKRQIIEMWVVDPTASHDQYMRISHEDYRKLLLRAEAKGLRRAHGILESRHTLTGALKEIEKETRKLEKEAK